MYREVNEMPKCASCGILLPCSEIVFEHHGRCLYACSERCVRTYETYKFPRYEREIAALEESGASSPRLGYVPASAA